MREIKFRAYHTEKRDGQEFPRMMDWDEILNNDEEELACYFRNEFSNVSPLMQYTGMKDKNGREIYEGDIVFDERKNSAEVVFDDGCFCVIGYLGDLRTHPIRDSLFCGERFEVIGNIYENPELLEAAE
ncbi:YopX family protein [Bacillus mojavensis]|uniref:YopX family protein n=1 Tax=Bacillus mojavensis TaxID=72360 RepID=UPI002DB7C656|nr:YopX family protein [Bacillus mojavensis]MEC1682489.1 YopX family protein [Bacillus mojavensis]MEC1708477.1 YopX family protein [Bacillus mojavensis]